MRTFDVNDNNDLFIAHSGHLAIAVNEQAVRNVAAHYVRALRGEMIHKADAGIPYWKTTFGRQADVPMFEAAFRGRMREIPQITAVRSFSATSREGTLSYVAILQTEYGDITLNG